MARTVLLATFLLAASATLPEVSGQAMAPPYAQPNQPWYAPPTASRAASTPLVEPLAARLASNGNGSDAYAWADRSGGAGGMSSIGSPHPAASHAAPPYCEPQADAYARGYGEPHVGYPAYPGAVSYFDQSAESLCYAPAPEQTGRGWFVGAGGLLLTRNDENYYPFSYDSANESIQLTDSRDANGGFAGGVEFRVGRFFLQQTQAVELVYWGAFPGVGSTVTTGSDTAGSLNGILNWDQLDYGGFSADTFVNNAEAHGVFRDAAYHNIEVNIWRWPVGCQSCSNFQAQWVLGARYFLFSDHLTFVADTQNRVFNGAAEELEYAISVDNHLIGGQAGGQASWGLTSCLRADLGVKLGLYGNAVSHRSRIGGALGTATINNGPFNGREFLVDNSEGRVSFLGELNAGLSYAFLCRGVASIGYRAVAVTGVALPTNQIYPDLRGVNDVEIVDVNGDLVLHGAYATIGWNF